MGKQNGKLLTKKNEKIYQADDDFNLLLTIYFL